MTALGVHFPIYFTTRYVLCIKDHIKQVLNLIPEQMTLVLSFQFSDS